MIPGTRAADAILAAVLPSTAARLAIAPDVDTSLRGGAPDGDRDRGPDVDIFGSRPGKAGAPVAVRIIDASEHALDIGSKARMVVRLRDHLSARTEAFASSRVLRRQGYPATERVFWDRGQVARLGSGDGSPPLRLAERLPRRAVVVGRRAGEAVPTILEAAADAGLGHPAPRPLVRSGTLVCLDTAAVLRVAVGAGSARVERSSNAIRHLQTTLARPELIPSPLATGRAGLGTWATESRLRGRPSAAAIAPAVADDVLEFLVSLRAAVPAGDAAVPVGDIASSIVGVLGAGRRSEGLLAAAAAASPALVDVGSAFVHGDLWHGNLLLEDGRLSGVIDWDSAGPGRLPFLDALHVVIAARVPRGSRQWGAEVLEAWRSPAVPELVRRYANAIGVNVDPARLRSLVIAYWLDRLAFQITTYGDRTDRPRWLAQNVDLVIDALETERS